MIKKELARRRLLYNRDDHQKLARHRLLYSKDDQEKYYSSIQLN
jgi:hypothetical protein